MANTPSTPIIEALAAEIGEQVYIDVAKWHLFLTEAHLHTTLAEQVYPLLEDGLSASAITSILKNISVPLGGGKITVPLADLIPASSQATLLKLLEEYQRDQ
jgi:hypothetical protein